MSNFLTSLFHRTPPQERPQTWNDRGQEQCLAWLGTYFANADKVAQSKIDAMVAKGETVDLEVIARDYARPFHMPTVDAIPTAEEVPQKPKLHLVAHKPTMHVKLPTPTV